MAFPLPNATPASGAGQRLKTDLITLAGLFGNTSATCVVVHEDGSQSTYNAASNTDAARGTALLAALTAMVSGDALFLSGGNFDCGSSRVVLPAGTSMHGAGIGVTNVKTSYSNNLSNASVTFGNSCLVAGLTLTNYSTAAVAIGVGTGTADTGFTGTANLSAVQIVGPQASATEAFPLILWGGGGTLRVYDSQISCVESSSGNIYGAVAVAGTLRLFNCDISITGGTAGTYFGAYAAGGQLQVLGGMITMLLPTPSGSATVYSLWQQPPNKLLAVGVVLSTSPIVSGTGVSADVHGFALLSSVIRRTERLWSVGLLHSQRLSWSATYGRCWYRYTTVARSRCRDRSNSRSFRK